MAQAGPSLGRSILTPKPQTRPRNVQIPSGNYWPVRGQTPTSSNAQQAKQYVAPTANMTEPQAVQEPVAAAPPPYTGKGKAPAEAQKLPSQELNGASSLASPPSERADSPMLDNDLDPTIAAAMRYQAEVDELEREQDREDSTYPEPTPDPEDRLEAETLNGIRNTPRTRSRAPANKDGFDARPMQQPDFQLPSSPPTQHPARKKRQAADTCTTKTTPAKKPRRSTNKVHHNNQTFVSLKIASKTKRTDALKRIKSVWKITEEKLMDLPFAPRRTTDPGHPVIKPLDWNNPLLEALVDLALLTPRQFERACTAAKEAFETESLFNGATQLTSEFVKVAIRRIQSASSDRENPRHVQHQSADVASAKRPAARPDQPRPPKDGNVAGSTPAERLGDRSAPASKAVPRSDQQSSLEQGLATSNSPTRAAVGHSEPVAASRTATRTPLSPAASPTSLPIHPIKVEQAASGAQQTGYTWDSEPSGSQEDRLEWESKMKIHEYEIAILREKLANDDRKRKEKEKKAARLRQHGGSVGDALLM